MTSRPSDASSSTGEQQTKRRPYEAPSVKRGRSVQSATLGGGGGNSGVNGMQVRRVPRPTP